MTPWCYGERVEFNPDPVDAVQKSYDAGVTDEFVDARGLRPRTAMIQDGRRRASSSTSAPTGPGRSPARLVDPDFDGFPAQDAASSRCHFVCTTQYDATMPNVQVAFPSQKPAQHLWRVYLRQRA